MDINFENRKILNENIPAKGQFQRNHALRSQHNTVEPKFYCIIKSLQVLEILADLVKFSKILCHGLSEILGVSCHGLSDPAKDLVKTPQIPATDLVKFFKNFLPPWRITKLNTRIWTLQSQFRRRSQQHPSN